MNATVIQGLYIVAFGVAIVAGGFGGGSVAPSRQALKRSMRPGFAGVDNELYYDAKTAMLFGDAKSSVAEITEELKAL